VDVTTTDVPAIDQQLTLTCSATTTVRGDTNRVDITWKSGKTQVRRRSNVLASSIGTLSVYTDSYTVTSSLSVDDIGDSYQCEVVINTVPVITTTSSITIPIPPASGKCVMFIMITWLYESCSLKDWVSSFVLCDCCSCEVV